MSISVEEQEGWNDEKNNNCSWLRFNKWFVSVFKYFEGLPLRRQIKSREWFIIQHEK